MKKFKYCKDDADQVLNYTDPIKTNQPVIGAIKEALRGQLTSNASKLLSCEHSTLEDLSVEEQNLWRSFDNSDIYEFISGEPDCHPEFQFDWIEPCQLAAHLPPGVVFAHPHNFQPPPDQHKPPVQPAQPLDQPCSNCSARATYSSACSSTCSASATSTRSTTSGWSQWVASAYSSTRSPTSYRS
jgi:hypothetical protein